MSQVILSVSGNRGFAINDPSRGCQLSDPRHLTPAQGVIVEFHVPDQQDPAKRLNNKGPWRGKQAKNPTRKKAFTVFHRFSSYRLLPARDLCRRWVNHRPVVLIPSGQGGLVSVSHSVSAGDPVYIHCERDIVHYHWRA